MITLRAGSIATAEVDPQGAYVTAWSVGPRKVLFPRQYIGEKLRGGIPVCAPIFGPGTTVGLPQHGFARNLQWEVTEQTESQVVCVLSNPSSQFKNLPDVYSGCWMQLTVSLETRMLSLQLELRNEGTEAFVCSPGMHPYFATQDATKVEVQFGESTHTFTSPMLAATYFSDPHQPEAGLSLEGGTLRVKSSELQTYAVWSADPDNYICLEPTMQGNLTDSTDPILSPGGRMTYTMKIEMEHA